MQARKQSFGLSGQMVSNYDAYDDQSYDNLFGIGKKAKERRDEKREKKADKKAENKAKKDERQKGRQEKRDLANEKRKLKNEMKQAEIEEKNAQNLLLNKAGGQGSDSDESEGGDTGEGEKKEDNTMLYGAIAAGVVLLAVGGYIYMKKKAPVPQPILLKAAA